MLYFYLNKNKFTKYCSPALGARALRRLAKFPRRRCAGIWLSSCGRRGRWWCNRTSRSGRGIFVGCGYVRYPRSVKYSVCIGQNHNISSASGSASKMIVDLVHHRCCLDRTAGLRMSRNRSRHQEESRDSSVAFSVWGSSVSWSPPLPRQGWPRQSIRGVSYSCCLPSMFEPTKGSAHGGSWYIGSLFHSGGISLIVRFGVMALIFELFTLGINGLPTTCAMMPGFLTGVEAQQWCQRFVGSSANHDPQCRERCVVLGQEWRTRLDKGWYLQDLLVWYPHERAHGSWWRGSWVGPYQMRDFNEKEGVRMLEWS